MTLVVGPYGSGGTTQICNILDEKQVKKVLVFGTCADMLVTATRFVREHDMKELQITTEPVSNAPKFSVVSPSAPPVDVNQFDMLVFKSWSRKDNERECADLKKKSDVNAQTLMATLQACNLPLLQDLLQMVVLAANPKLPIRMNTKQNKIVEVSRPEDVPSEVRNQFHTFFVSPMIDREAQVQLWNLFLNGRLPKLTLPQWQVICHSAVIDLSRQPTVIDLNTQSIWIAEVPSPVVWVDKDPSSDASFEVTLCLGVENGIAPLSM